jgi:nicotinamide-nucleotide adenylyltransferase
MKRYHLIGHEHKMFHCIECMLVYDGRMEGLYIGRFQPFHNGHLSLIKEILKKVKKIHIVIGSSQHSDTKENPFSADERAIIIKAALKEEGITQYDLTPVPDIMWHNKYADHVKSFVPHFNVVFVAENRHLQELFTQAGYVVETHERIGPIVATEIRERMAKKEQWEHLVPPTVAAEIKKIKGEKRVKRLLTV